MKRPRILVVGSSNTDLVVRADRIPLPGETILGGDLEMFAGGKGANQAAAAARLGADVALIARVGRDAFGDASLSSLETFGVDTSQVVRDTEAPSGVALISVDRDGQNAILVAPGANGRLSPNDIKNSCSAFEWADMVLVQLEIPLETVEATTQLAARYGVPLMLNPAPAAQLAPEWLRQVRFLVPNEGEARLLTGAFSASHEDLANALLGLGAAAAVMTLGEAGAIAKTPSESVRLPAFPVSAADTTAAGDCFCGALAVALARGKALKETLRFACAAAAISVTRPGAQSAMPSVLEVERLLETYPE